MTTVTNGDISLEVAVQGDGPLIVFVHGWPELWHSWRHQMDHCAGNGYRVAALNVRGYGNSSNPPEIERYVMREMTADVAAVIDALGEVAPGDGIVFEGDREHHQEQGGRIYEVTIRGKLVELAFGRDAIDFSRVHAGQQIWKTDDPQLTNRLRKTFTGKPNRRVPIDIEVSARVGSRLRLSRGLRVFCAKGR